MSPIERIHPLLAPTEQEGRRGQELQILGGEASGLFGAREQRERVRPRPSPVGGASPLEIVDGVHPGGGTPLVTCEGLVGRLCRTRGGRGTPPLARCLGVDRIVVAW